MDSIISAVNPFATVVKSGLLSDGKTKEDVHIEVDSSYDTADTIRNFLNIPRKVLYLDSSMGSGNVSSETIDKMREYLDKNGLHDVYVSVNRYEPQEMWQRTFSNPKTSTLCSLY